MTSDDKKGKFKRKQQTTTVIDQYLPIIDDLLGEITPDKIPETLDEKLVLLQKYFKIFEPLGMSSHATERVVNFANYIELKSSPEQIIQTYKKYLKEIR